MANKEQRILGVIPARYASTRLPGKPLASIAGKSLVERVWHQANLSKLITDVIVATDDERVADEVRSFGGNVMMTAEDLQSGSERVAAVAHELADTDWHFVANVQGDMPFIHPSVIDKTISFFDERYDEFSMATVATPIYHKGMFDSPSDVKVVVSERGQGLYFSRASIPFSRDGELISGRAEQSVYGHKHFGLYIYKKEALAAFDNSQRTTLEKVEMLEQLRLLEKGYRIGVCVVEPELTQGSVEVDTPADLIVAEKLAQG